MEMEATELQQATEAAEALGKRLSADATEYIPSEATPQKSSPVKPVKTRDLFEKLDYVPFTPSQGICTPSPSNAAALWMHQNCIVDRSHPSFSSLTPSSNFGSGSYYVPALYPVYPMPYSPAAAAAEYAAVPPHTPSHIAASWSPGVAPGPTFFAAMTHSPGPAAFVGSPALVSGTPGRAIFAQYLRQEGYGSDPSCSPPETGTSDGSTPGVKSEKRASPGAREAASAWCTERGVLGDPPQAVVELASLSIAYGVTLESAVEMASATSGGGCGASETSSPSKTAKSGGNSNNSNNTTTTASADGGGSMKLNARQRRTLRRAHERAMAAFESVTSTGQPPQPQETSKFEHSENVEHNSNNNNMYTTPLKPTTTTTTTTSTPSKNTPFYRRPVDMQTTPMGNIAINNNGGVDAVGMALGSPVPMMMWPGSTMLHMQHGMIPPPPPPVVGGGTMPHHPHHMMAPVAQHAYHGHMSPVAAAGVSPYHHQMMSPHVAMHGGGGHGMQQQMYQQQQQQYPMQHMGGGAYSAGRSRLTRFGRTSTA